MAKFEYRTNDNAHVETIDAESYDFDTQNGKLTFTEKGEVDIASFAIEKGAYVKRVGK